MMIDPAEGPGRGRARLVNLLQSSSSPAENIST